MTAWPERPKFAPRQHNASHAENALFGRWYPNSGAIRRDNSTHNLIRMDLNRRNLVAKATVPAFFCSIRAYFWLARGIHFLHYPPLLSAIVRKTEKHHFSVVQRGKPRRTADTPPLKEMMKWLLP